MTEIWGFEIYHGPVLLIGYFYEHTNFRNNTLYYPIYNGDYQSSAMISTQYSLGVEREMGDIFTSIWRIIADPIFYSMMT